LYAFGEATLLPEYESEYYVKLTLPAIVGTDATKPPAVACYISNTGSSQYFSVAGGTTTSGISSTTPYCTLTFESDGLYHVAMYNMSNGTTATFVVLY
jgi:hypothetical protein